MPNHSAIGATCVPCGDSDTGPFIVLVLGIVFVTSVILLFVKNMNITR